MNATLAFGPFGSMELLVIAILFGGPLLIVGITLLFVFKARKEKGSAPPPLPGQKLGE